MSEETHREVRTDFTAEDRGLGSSLHRFGEQFERGAHQLEGYKERLSEFRREQGLTTVAALGLGYGVGSWLEKIKESNAEFGRAQRGVAGVLSTALAFQKGTSEVDRYKQALQVSQEVTEQAEATAARFGLTLEDTATTYKKIAIAAGGLGLTQKQVNDLTVSAAATAARYQVSGEMAATTIARAMRTGAVRGVDEFSLSLGRAIGNVRKLNQEQRFDRIQKALQGSVQVADAMNQTIGGALGRIRNVVDETLRDLTKPIFGDISKRLEEWGKHLREVRENGHTLIEEFSGKLLTGFRALADVTATLKDHWVSIGAVFAAMKVGGIATQIAGSLGGAAGVLAGGGGAARYLGGALGGAGSVFGAIGALAPAFGGIVTAAALASIALKGVYDEWQGRKKQAAELSDFFTEAGKIAQTNQYIRKHNNLSVDQVQQGKDFVAAHAQAAAEILKTKGLLEDGRLNVEKFNGIIDAMSDDVRQKFASQLGLEGLGDVSASTLGAAAAEVFARAYREPSKTSASAEGDRKFAKQVINNNIGTMNVVWKNEEQDPDRVFVRFIDDVHRYVNHRTQAMTAEPLGEY